MLPYQHHGNCLAACSRILFPYWALKLKNQRHPKVTSGRMMDTELLTLINPFVKFVRNDRKLRNVRRIPDRTVAWLLRW